MAAIGTKIPADTGFVTAFSASEATQIQDAGILPGRSKAI
jgi:hypothetical protein